MAKGVNLNPKMFQDAPLCDLCFEDVLREGSRKSAGLKPQDFKETSIRFCVDGLYKWYKSYARHYSRTSVFMMIRDASWWWSSFCGTNDTLTSLVKEYYALLKTITEETDYADLADKMDDASRLEKVGKSKSHLSITVPLEAHGIIGDCSVALGVPFSQFYQLGLGRALASNQQGLYSAWVESKVNPLFDEVMARAVSRLESFLEINNDVVFRQSRKE